MLTRKPVLSPAFGSQACAPDRPRLHDCDRLFLYVTSIYASFQRVKYGCQITSLDHDRGADRLHALQPVFGQLLRTGSAAAATMICSAHAGNVRLSRLLLTLIQAPRSMSFSACDHCGSRDSRVFYTRSSGVGRRTIPAEGPSGVLTMVPRAVILILYPSNIKLVRHEPLNNLRSPHFEFPAYLLISLAAHVAPIGTLCWPYTPLSTLNARTRTLLSVSPQYCRYLRPLENPEHQRRLSHILGIL